MTINPCLLWFISPLAPIVSFHGKQGMLSVNIHKVVYIVNKVTYTLFYNFLWYMKQNLQVPVVI